MPTSNLSLSEATKHIQNLEVMAVSDSWLSSHVEVKTKLKSYNQIVDAQGSEQEQNVCIKLTHEFISGKLDYCSGLFTGLSRNSIRQLQLTQYTHTANPYTSSLSDTGLTGKCYVWFINH